MNSFTITTEAFLVMLHALRTRLSKTDIRIGLTKSNMLHPDTLSVIFVKKEDRSLYIQMNTRYSVSGKEFVLESFRLFDYSAGGPEPLALYTSRIYRTLIHDANFISELIKDINTMIDIIEKEML